MQNAFASVNAANSISPYSVTPNFRNPQVQTYNTIVQQRLAAAWAC